MFLSDSSNIIFEAYGKKGIKNNLGEILLSAKYESLSWVENPNKVLTTVIPYQKNGHWGLLSRNFEELTEAKYSSLIPFNETSFIASIKGKYSQTIFYGLIDLKGGLELPFSYRKLIPAGKNLIAASKINQSINYGIIDEKGRSITSFSYYQIKYLGGDYFTVTDNTAISSLISASSPTAIILNQIDSASMFSNDLSIVYQYGRAGVFHNNGKLVLPIAYKNIAPNDGKVMKVRAFNKWEVLDEQGKMNLSFYADSIHFINSRQIILSLNGQSFLKEIHSDSNKVEPLGGYFLQSWGKYLLLKNSSGSQLIDTISYKVVMQLGEFLEANDHYLVCRSREFSGVSYTVVNGRAEKLKASAFELNNELITVKTNGYWGVYDERFMEVISPIYDMILPGNLNEYVVRFRGDLGVIDLSQTWVISPTMLQIDPLGDNKYWAVNRYFREFIIQEDTVKEADLHFLNKGDYLYETNNEGAIRLLNSQATPVMIYKEGVFNSQSADGFLVKSSNRFKFFNFNGEEVFSVLNYDSVGLIQANFLPVIKGGAFGFIDLKGNLRIANRYGGVLPFEEGLAAVQINNKWGYINKEEELVIQPYYEEALSFVNGRALVKRGGKIGIIDDLGNTVIETAYDSIFNSNEFVLLRKGSLWGFGDQQGNIIRYPNYDHISLLNGALLVEKYQQFELFNYDGSKLLDNRYNAIYWDKEHQSYLTYNRGIEQIVFLSDLKSALIP
ncbi:MAG: hypothetical protein ACJAT1_001519 [Marivirga sp.]